MPAVAAFIRKTPVPSLLSYFEHTGIDLPIAVNWSGRLVRSINCPPRPASSRWMSRLTVGCDVLFDSAVLEKLRRLTRSQNSLSASNCIR